MDTEVDIFYIAQTVSIGVDDFFNPAPAGTQAALRIHPYVHTDAPFSAPGGYDRTNSFRSFVMRPSDSTLTSIGDPATSAGHGDVYTHVVLPDPEMRWSPHNMYIPNNLYEVTDLNHLSNQDPGALISVAIRQPGGAPNPLGKRAVVTYHQITSGDFSDGLVRISRDDEQYSSNPVRVLDLFNAINTSTRVNNNNGDIDRLIEFGRFVDIGFENNQFVYKRN